MPWSYEFLRELRKPVSYPRFRVEIARVDLYQTGAALNLASHFGSLGFPCAITPQSSITGGQLSVGDWNYTVGELSLGLVSDIDIRERVPKGVLIQLLMGFRGWDDGQFERVFLGQVQDVRWVGTQWQISARSMLGAIISRFTGVVLESALFHELQDTALDVAYNAGDGTVNVLSTAGADRISVGDDYLIQIEADEGDPFFLTANGITATSFTGCSGAAQLGTTAADASSGNTVTICAFIERNPVEAALALLTSTGTTVNGDYDYLPESWGFGLPDEYVDVADSLRTMDIINPSSGSVLWDIYSGTPQDDGAGWLRSVLNPAGMWLGERQGSLTVRAVAAVGTLAYLFEGVGDSEIVEIRGSAWNPSQPVEYGNVSLYTAAGLQSGSTLASLTTRPALVTKELVWPYCEENEAQWGLKGVTRLNAYHTLIGEVIEVTLAGWRLAHLCPGDHVILSSEHLPYRYGHTVEGLSLVLSCQADWFGATTTLRLVRY